MCTNTKEEGTHSPRCFCCPNFISDLIGESPILLACKKGTGTRPDYLANRADQKNEGPLGEKIAWKSRISHKVNGGGVGAHGQSNRKLEQVLEPNTHAHKMCLLSHLLRSFWNALAQNCYSFPCSLYWCPGTLLFVFFCVGFESTQLARRVQPELLARNATSNCHGARTLLNTSTTCCSTSQQWEK